MQLKLGFYVTIMIIHLLASFFRALKYLVYFNHNMIDISNRNFKLELILFCYELCNSTMYAQN